MVAKDNGRPRGPAHARKRSLNLKSEERLVEFGRQLPPPSENELEIVAGLQASRRRRRLFTWGTVLIVTVLCGGAIAQWLRPLPHPTLKTPQLRLPGMAPSFTWPSSGEAAAAVVGVGTVGQVRGSRPVPIAGLAEVLAAYVVLSDHRLAPGADGPAIPVSAAAVAAYQAGQARQESEVPITAGESLTELQALEGLLVDSGVDMATVLAEWDAGSVSSFVTKMNTAASRLGLTSTHITDPSGVDPATMSTAEDLVRLGEASLSIPTLRQIVSLTQASVPMTTVVYNPNFDLAHDGIIGIKTASDSSAQGCYLYAAQQNIAGKDVMLVGAVLGQPGKTLGPNAAAVDAGDALVRSVFVALRSFTIYAPGQEVGEVVSAWGSKAPVTVARPVNVLGWPHLVATLDVRPGPLDAPLPGGATIGVLRAGVGHISAQVPLRTVSALSGPGLWWRLTR